MAHYSLYTCGSRIWIQDKETWKGAVVQTDYDGKSLSFKLDDGGTLQVVNSTPAQLPPLRNPDILIGLNDLTTLSYLHEPGVLFNLKYRFTEMKTIYTYCGIVLVAINPYQKLGIYGVETMWTYRGHAIGELEPHVFAVAEEAFKEMERASLNQSIIVSGESGAGKTVSAKYAMRYFATVGGAESVTSIERKVLASQPIMEAIGNAKTTRNDNSSRFGKYVELQFSSAYSIIGASMRTYLLEKSRVVFQAPGERNYHIFYQILTSEDDEVSDLSLGSTKFNYTKTMSIKGVNDASQFTDTVQSMKLLGFGIDDRRNYFKLLAGILHLGNIVFKPKDEGCVIEMPSPPLMVLSSLLSISASELTKWLTFRRIRSAHEEFLKPMTVSEAEFSRDALAKLMYDLSFNWIVERVNETLKSDEECFKFIGVLDIYGFETFEINSFEQFCINYANEKLQQQFNSHMFKLDQEEYAKESIEWTFIDFYDNQPCIDLIETKLGILSLLDEETRMPAANDKSWTMKLYKECGKYPHFKTPKRADGEDFTIVHFASEVKYTSSGFLEKNRDTVLADQIQTVKNSTNPFIASIISIDETTVATVARKKTVSTQFRSSLSSLMTSLNSTTPHYIRCIKPNDDKVPFQFEDSRALQQLRACGVLETVRIQASGFPTRWTYVDFAKRYRVLCKSTEIKRNDIKGTSIGILTRHITDSSTYKLGTTKIFFRSGVLAYLEKLRSAKLQICIQRIQKTVRGWLARRRYAKIKKSCALLQRYGRGYLARRQFMLMKQTAAAITIQKYTRMYIVRREYTTLRTLISKLQTHCRMRLAIQKAQRLRVERATIIIQKNIRMYLVRKRYQEIRRGIILLQSCTRRILAKRELKALKLEARSLEHVKQLNKGLENKIIELQLRIEAQAKVMIKSDQMAAELVTSKAQLTGLKQLETKYKQAEKTIESHVAAIQKLESSLRTETDEKVDLIYRNKKLEGDCTDLKQRIGRLEAENQRMEDEVKKLMQQLIGFNNLKNDYETLERERDEERMAHQGMAPKKNPPVPAPRAKATPTDAFVNTLQIENALLKKKLDESTLDVLKLHDLEMQNEQAQANYRNLLLSNSPTEDVRKQVKEQGEELALKREENLMLRSLLSSGNSDREIITTLEQQLTAEKLNVKHLLEENKRLRGYAGGKDDESVYETAAYELNTNRVNNQSPYSGSVAQLLPRRELPAPENYTGLLQYDPTAEHRILKSILVDLKPTVALSLDPPTLPAFIIFMMIKYIDSLNDETRLQPLFKNFVKMLNKVIQKRNQLEYNFLWLSNVLRLLHNLKQYSGESAFVRENTPKQNDQCLINFDLIEFRQGLSDLGLRFYVALIKNFEDQVQPLIVPALLESSPELTSTIINKSKDKSKPMDILTRELSANYDLLVQFQMDLEVITQIFKQLFYYLTAASMNNLLLRKDLCNWSNGIQIRYNISQLEEWCRNKSLDSIIPILQPIIQASRLLQANKSEKDVDNVCEMCDELTVGQVIKILHLFTADEEELRVSSSFIKKVQLKLSTRKVGPETSQQLLMDTKHLLPVKFPYHPSSIKLDELNIPEALGLAELVTKL